jgi:hypothetical protein
MVAFMMLVCKAALSRRMIKEVVPIIVLVSTAINLVLLTFHKGALTKNMTLGTSGCVAYTTALYLPGGGTACFLFNGPYEAKYLDCRDYSDYANEVVYKLVFRQLLLFGELLANGNV